MRDKGLHLRNARSEELDEVVQLLKAANQQYKTSVPAPAWESYLKDLEDVHSRLAVSQLIVAEVNKQVVGTITLYMEGSHYSSPKGLPKGWAGIRLLAVHPAHRGRGIGHKLMEECIRRCREHKVVTIGLHTTKFMDIARRMYERMGFRHIPEFDFQPAPGVDVTAYRLDL
jgi:ribosomal protein S18 acetylase RimI-like enzyme